MPRSRGEIYSPGASILLPRGGYCVYSLVATRDSRIHQRAVKSIYACIPPVFVYTLHAQNGLLCAPPSKRNHPIRPVDEINAAALLLLLLHCGVISRSPLARACGNSPVIIARGPEFSIDRRPTGRLAASLLPSSI